MGKIHKLSIPKKATYLRLEEDIDFYVLFKKIEQDSSTCFFFESLGEENIFSRYAVIGFDPDYVVSATKDTIQIDDTNIRVSNPYLTLSELLPQDIISRNYAGGLVGYLGYDAVSFFEPALHIQTHPCFDQFLFGMYTDGIILDKITGEIFYFYYHTNRIEQVVLFAKQKLRKNTLKVTQLSDSLDKLSHEKLVKEVLNEIKRGNTFQCEIGMKTEFQIAGNPIELYDRLRRINPSPFMYFIKCKDTKIIGASPELLFSLRNKEMASFPLAGTIQRGKNSKQDQQFAKKLLNDPKEVAEHTMIVDLHRNDLGKVANYGSVKVRNFMDIKRFSHVQHISSEITGTIRNDHTMFSALAANFPAGTLSGAPKIESMKIINRLEKKPRGPYGGGVGHFGFNGDCTFAIPIRTIFIAGAYGYSQASSGIVFDSEPAAEFEEIQRKLAPVKEILFT